MRKNNSQFGFTLIEVLMSVAVFALIGTGIIVLVSNILRSSNQQSNLLSDQDQARRLAFGIVSELRNASTGADGSNSIYEASPQELIFFSNLKGTGSTISKVRYYLQNGALYKGVTAPTGSPATYPSSNEVVTLVQSNLANGGDPVFYYYDGSYDGVTGDPLSQPVNLNSVKFIKVVLKIYNKAGFTNTNYYTITSSATIRNLKNNLGD